MSDINVSMSVITVHKPLLKLPSHPMSVITGRIPDIKDPISNIIFTMSIIIGSRPGIKLKYQLSLLPCRLSLVLYQI